MFKRIFDLICSAISLLLLMPVAILIAFIIYFEDGGSVFFKQRRIGIDHQPFILYKFRSMKYNNNSFAGSFEVGDHSRITRIGKILRKTKLDEIPQLFNVLKGNMSLVGPRPEVEKWVAEYPQQWAFILTIKPGITDNASILFCNEEEILAKAANPEDYYKEIILPQKLNIYCEYVKDHSFIGDIRIIFKTLISILAKYKQ